MNQEHTDFAKARGEAVRTAKVALESAGFGLPEPIYRVRLDAAGGNAALTENVVGTPASPRPASAPAKTVPAVAPPPESDPMSHEDPTEEAVTRERKSRDAGEDLLGEGARGE